MHSLRTSCHLLQLVPQSALSKVSGRGSRPLAGKASSGASSDPLRARGLHATSSFGPVGVAEQEGRLRSSVSHQCGNASRSRSQSPTSRCRNRLLQRAAHLESKTRTSSACALRGAGRGAVRRSHALDQTTLRLLSSRQSTESRLPRQVPPGTQTRLPERPTQLSWRLEAPRSAQNLCCLAETTVPKRLGGLRETTLRRPRVCAPLSGPLHSSRRHLQSPTALLHRPESHLSLA